MTNTTNLVLPDIVVRYDPDFETFSIGFRGVSFYDWFTQEELQALFCDIPRLTLAIRFCNWIQHYDPFNGVDGNVAVTSVFNALDNDRAILIEELKRDLDDLSDDPIFFCDEIKEAERLIEIISE